MEERQSLSLRMVQVPAGTIVLRDDRTRNQWRVELKSYQLASVPVTQAVYAAVTGKTPSSYRDPQNPVESVSWLDAVLFCNLFSRIRSDCSTATVSMRMAPELTLFKIATGTACQPRLNGNTPAEPERLHHHDLVARLANARRSLSWRSRG